MYARYGQSGDVVRDGVKCADNQIQVARVHVDEQPRATLSGAMAESTPLMGGALAVSKA
jgi:hypothetical protein